MRQTVQIQAAFILQLNAKASAINFASYLPDTDNAAAAMVLDTAVDMVLAELSPDLSSLSSAVF
jgi:hypothetical protein